MNPRFPKAAGNILINFANLSESRIILLLGLGIVKYILKAQGKLKSVNSAILPSDCMQKRHLTSLVRVTLAVSFIQFLPPKLLVRSRAQTVFARSNTAIVGSNPT
jgi:hypothetical protein